ncbi:MAG: CdaR family protein [Bacteroidota bacterium]|nr:CdaR family protein [Bacteroidota bacterium]
MSGLVKKNIFLFFKLLLKNKNVVVFVISMAIAFVFWVLLALNKEYVTTLTLNVKYGNIPKHLVLKKPLPQKLKFKIKSEGWDILSLKKSQSENDVFIDLSDFVSSNFILTSELKNFLDLKKESFFNILKIYPDTIHLDFEQIARKNVPIELLLDISYANQFSQSGKIKLKPYRVLVTGPKSTIRNLNKLTTEKITLTNVSSTINENVSLTIPSKMNITMEVDKVNVIIPIEKFTEGNLSLKIKAPNSLSNSIKLIPKTATVTFQTALSNYKNVTPATLEVFFDTLKINAKENNKLKLFVKSKNKFVKNLSVEPKYVDYIIKK